MQKEFADWSDLDILVRKVLTKRHNILRESSGQGGIKGTQGKTWMQQDTLYCVE